MEPVAWLKLVSGMHYIRIYDRIENFRNLISAM